MAEGRGRISGLIPLVVVVVIVVLFARSCFERLDPGGDEREPENAELGQGQVFDEDGEEDDPAEVAVPEIEEDQLEAMLDPRGPECPAEDGEAERHLQWTEPPPMCIDEDRAYTATLVTSRGDIEIELDVDNAPTTVNNFVFLARWRFYEDTEFDAVFPGATVQGGLPLGPDSDVVGPGYTIEDELPEGDETPYPRYSMALGNTGEPDSGGSAFLLMMADDGTQQRDPIYSRFGQITDPDSQAVVDAIEDTGRRRPGSDGTPTEPTLIHEVTITES